ncbi:MAG TPA: DUF6084 family protein [Blastocatellia bacterium]|nr:DUF6084 family protein [Blastocatellia bacterium]
MPDLNFQVVGAEPDPYAAAPLLLFKLRVDNSNAEEQIFTITLRCQVQLEVNRRRYQAPEQARLRDLFGEPERWDVTLRPLLWTHTQAVVQQFTAGTQVDLPVPCTFDFNVAATKYFAGLEQGEVPLLFQFSGTIFYTTAEGALQVTQIPWSKEARYRLPIAVWQQMMDLYYPNSAWLCLRRDLFDRLYLYKVERGLPTWEHVLESLLPAEPPAEQPAKAREQ